MSSHLKPMFYLVRENGVIVPLVAMDELPHHVRIQGVERQLSPLDIVDMEKCVGTYRSRHCFHQIEMLNQGQAGDGSLLVQERNVTHVASRSTSPNLCFSTNKASLTDAVIAVDKAVAAPLPHGPSAAPHLPQKGKKVYCSHWMSTGECDFAQQGCIYKHEMPLDPNLLKGLGYLDIPKWYRELHGIGRISAVPGSDAHIDTPLKTQAMRQNWRELALTNSRCGSQPFLAIRGRPSAASRRTRPGQISLCKPSQIETRKSVLKSESLMDDAVETASVVAKHELLLSKHAPLQPATSNGSGSSSNARSVRASHSSGSKTDPSSTVNLAKMSAVPMDEAIKKSSRTSSEASVQSPGFQPEQNKPSSVRGRPTRRSRRRESVSTVNTAMTSDIEAGLVRRERERAEKEEREYAFVKARHEQQQRMGIKQSGTEQGLEDRKTGIDVAAADGRKTNLTAGKKAAITGSRNKRGNVARKPPKGFGKKTADREGS